MIISLSFIWFLILNYVFLLQLGIVCSYAVAAADDIHVSPQQYWDSALPNTPIPKAIESLLGSGWYMVILK